MKALLKKWFGITRINAEFAQVNGHIQELERTSYTPMRGAWRTLQVNYYESAVNLALRDLCRPGMVVFDCGANIGMLTLVMSRLVGPRGIVCAFEASPRNIEMCERDLIANGCGNVVLHHRALCDRSGERVPFYFRDHGQADGMMGGPNESPACQVLSLALDDFVTHSGLVPEVVKMDIEGAEFNALRGFRTILDRHRPHLILETQTTDQRSLDFLRDRGYRAIDLETYREISTLADYPAGALVRNVLFIHCDRMSETNYQLPIASEQVAVLSARDFVTASSGETKNAHPLDLPPGRYAIDMAARPIRNEWIRCGVRIGDETILEYQATADWICASYRDWVIDLDRPESITLFANPATNIRVDGASIRRIVPLSKPAPWRAYV